MVGVITTMEISVTLEEAENTGLITPEAVDAFEAEKLLAKEQIKELERSQRENVISRKAMAAQIKTIQQEMKDKAIELGLDLDMDMLSQA